VLGKEISMPLMVAPTSVQRVTHPDGEPGLARAAAGAGTVYTLSTLASVRPGELAGAAGVDSPRWFQLYWFRDRGFTRDLVQEAAAGGFAALVLTVDLPEPGPRERDRRSGFALPDDLPMPNLPRTLVGASYFHDTLSEVVDTSLTWRDLEWLRAECPLPLVVKGLLTAEDALLACEHGAAGVVVSNHGGRQLDGVAPTLRVLPEVVAAVAGRVEILLDGGIRRGGDVVKALALGARAVLVGRAYAYGLGAGGEAGVSKAIRILRDDIERTLRLLGRPSVGALDASCVSVPPQWQSRG
jgi:isopentenyl diphosphate isomerase/L-lactate dehydrogenase-like FMN-dependent dehydrogenase